MMTSIKHASLATIVIVAACGHKGRAPAGSRPASSEPPAVQAPGAPSAPGAPEPPGAAATTTTPGGAPATPEGPPEIQRIGRFDERDPAGPKCGWPGCRVIARFEGTAVSVRLDEQSLKDGPSIWDVAIDGRWSSLELEPGEHEYDLAAELPKAKHTVELYKRTEGQNGVTQLLGFDFHGGALLAPPPRKERRLEIVGDSDVSGFGYEGAVGADCASTPPWAARLENFRKAWGARLAQKLDAELHATVFSGKGFYYNIWRPDLDTIGVIYPRANPADASSVFELSRFVPDAVVVSIGGNDYNIGQPIDEGAPTLEAFTAKVRDFSMMLRAAYPRAYVLLMAYAALSDAYPPDRMRRTNVETAFKTVAAEAASRGDARVGFVAPAQYSPGELVGCSGHGGPAYHERIATFMAVEIASRLAW